MKLWILCGTGRDISIRFAQSIWQRRANSDETGGHLLRFCRNSAPGGSRFHCTCYGFNEKVQQVEYQFVGPAPAPLTVRHWQMSRLIVLDRHDREPVAQGTPLMRVLSDFCTSGSQNHHFDVKINIACASLSRKSHKRWGYVEITGLHYSGETITLILQVIPYFCTRSEFFIISMVVPTDNDAVRNMYRNHIFLSFWL